NANVQGTRGCGDVPGRVGRRGSDGVRAITQGGGDGYPPGATVGGGGAAAHLDVVAVNRDRAAGFRRAGESRRGVVGEVVAVGAARVGGVRHIRRRGSGRRRLVQGEGDGRAGEGVPCLVGRLRLHGVRTVGLRRPSGQRRAARPRRCRAAGGRTV